MSARHTPGPWIAEPIGLMGEWGIRTEGGRVDEIASCDAHNAHLIAAAPDLLEAVQRLLGWDWWDESWPDVTFARAAIAKATRGAP